jgi:muconolactone delta-isomerase
VGQPTWSLGSPETAEQMSQGLIAPWTSGRRKSRPPPAVQAGKIKALYKVSGQRRVVGIVDADSHDELDRIFMAALPMAHMLTFNEIVPVRDYMDFGEDIRKRWQQ